MRLGLVARVLDLLLLLILGRELLFRLGVIVVRERLLLLRELIVLRERELLIELRSMLRLLGLVARVRLLGLISRPVLIVWRSNVPLLRLLGRAFTSVFLPVVVRGEVSRSVLRVELGVTVVARGVTVVPVRRGPL